MINKQNKIGSGQLKNTKTGFDGLISKFANRNIPNKKSNINQPVLNGIGSKFKKAKSKRSKVSERNEKNDFFKIATKHIDSLIDRYLLQNDMNPNNIYKIAKKNNTTVRSLLETKGKGVEWDEVLEIKKQYKQIYRKYYFRKKLKGQDRDRVTELVFSFSRFMGNSDPSITVLSPELKTKILKTKVLCSFAIAISLLPVSVYMLSNTMLPTEYAVISMAVVSVFLGVVIGNIRKTFIYNSELTKKMIKSYPELSH